MKKLVLAVAIVFIFAISGSANAATLGASTYGKKCSICHGSDGTGGPMGPKLAGTDFLGGDAAAVTNILSSGKSIAGKGHPKPSLTDADIAAIIDYLQGL